jgi:hypothetical protein
MSSLEKFGITLDGAKILQHSDTNELSSDEFFERSTQLLEDIEGVVRDEVISDLENQYGRWHPSGFMVYPLGAHPELGGLRLHVWPQGLRQRKVEGLGWLDDEQICDGDIHNHAWHISSRVLSGQYSDNMYEVNSSGLEPGSLTDYDVAMKGLLHVFQVKYRTDTTPEFLQATGAYVTADITSRRQVNAGNIHLIEAGPFHAPTIAEDQLSATLVFNSHRVSAGGPDILVAGSSRPILGGRVDVSIEEAEEARAQIS